MKRQILYAVLVGAAFLACSVAVPAFAQKTTSTQIQYNYVKIKFEPHYQGEVNVGYVYADKASYSYSGDYYRFTRNRVFLTTVHGYRAAKWLFVGAGVGGRVWWPLYKFSNEEEYKGELLNFTMFSLPIFANVKFYLPISDDFSLYLTGNFGGDPILNGHHMYSGGYYGEYGIGLNYNRFIFDFGLQQECYKCTASYVEKVSRAIFYFKLGIMF